MSSRAQNMLRSVPEVLKPLLPEVCTALRESLVVAGEALNRGDVEGVRSAAHGLKGAAMRFGLDELAALAARAEESAASGNEAGASSYLAGFTARLAELEALVHAGWQ